MRLVIGNIIKLIIKTMNNEAINPIKNSSNFFTNLGMLKLRDFFLTLM
ncbi:MAG: hypothetical protein RR945_02065 [Erysipelotrichaceae bacterium]